MRTRRLSMCSTSSPATPLLISKTKKTANWARRIFLDPLKVILYMRFPAVQCTVWPSAITFGTLYALNVGIQAAFAHAPYNYSTWVVGLLYIPGSVGYMISSIFGGMWLDRVMIREAKKEGRYDANGKLILLPEDRMQENVWVAAIMIPLSLLLYGWTAQFGVYPAAPLVGQFFFGVGSMLAFGAVNTMLTEFMPGRSSSGVALNNFVRNILSCTGGIVGQPLIDVMGVGWLMTLVGLVSWISGNLCIYFLRKNSRKWRTQMDKALNGK